LFVPTTVLHVDQSSGKTKRTRNFKRVKSSLPMSQLLIPKDPKERDLSHLIRTPLFDEMPGKEITTILRMEIVPKRPKKWIELMHIYRRTYNLTIERINQRTKDEKIDKSQYRRDVIALVSKETDTTGIYELLDSAFQDAFKTFRAITSKKDGKSYTMHFKARKNPTWTMSIVRMGNKGPFPKRIQGEDEVSFSFKERKEVNRYYRNMHKRKPTEAEVNGYYLGYNRKVSPTGKPDWRTSNITFENGRWFVTIFREKTTNMKNKYSSIIALDPGSNPFLTGTDGNMVIRIGVDLERRLLKIDKKIDKLVGLKTKALSSIKKNIKNNTNLRQTQRYYDLESYWNKKIHKKRFRRRNILEHFQWKVANWLATNYDVVVLPKLETGKLVKGKPIKAINRNIMSLNLYKFLTKVKYQCNLHGCGLIHTHEWTTTKTLCLNGYKNETIGSSKVYKYKNLEIDRDANASINILLKTLIENPVLELSKDFNIKITTQV